MTDFEKAIEEAKAGALPYESWERLAGETGTAYAAFCCYRDIGPGRNIRKAVEAANEGKAVSAGSKQYGTWRQWSMKFHWVKRAADYDQHLEHLKQEERRKTIEAQGEMHRKVTGKMLDVVSKKLDTMSPDELTQSNVTEWVQTAIRAEREAAGLAPGNGGKAEPKQGELSFIQDFNGL
jgi:hypothetical protein